jgi:hypothetical protein
MLPICTIAGDSARPVVPVRFRAVNPSYMLRVGLSAMRDRWRAAVMLARAVGVAGAFTMGEMLALPFITGSGDRREILRSVAVGAVAG